MELGLFSNEVLAVLLRAERDICPSTQYSAGNVHSKLKMTLNDNGDFCSWSILCSESCFAADKRGSALFQLQTEQGVKALFRQCIERQSTVYL